MRSKQQSTQETGKGREYDVTRAENINTQWHAVTARLSLPVQIQHHHSCLSVGKRNTFWVGDNCRENLPAVSHISKCTAAGTSLNCIFISRKAMAHDSAERTSSCSTGLIRNTGNHRWAPSKQPTYESAYTNTLLQAHCSQLSKCALASTISAKTQHGTQEMEEERERGRVSLERSKIPTYASVPTEHLLPAAARGYLP